MNNSLVSNSKSSKSTPPVDLSRDWDAFELTNAVNFHVRPYPVSVLEARRIDDRFQARFSAIRRRYLYRIINRRAVLALDRKRAWHVPVPNPRH